MNFMGMGVPELGVIFLVAFLVLGPGRAIDTARNVGKVLGDLRRSFSDVTSAMSVETMDQTSNSSATQDQKPDPLPDPQMEPLPGVPMRAELPSEDADVHPSEESAASSDEISERSGSEEKG